MDRPAIHNWFRMGFILFGIVALIVALATILSWADYKRADGIVQVRQPAFVKLGTNPITEVHFRRPLGLDGYVPFPERSLPAGSRSGDHVCVLYHDIGGRDAVIYSFDLVWRIPISAAIVGVVSILLGMFFRRRPGTLLRMSVF